MELSGPKGAAGCNRQWWQQISECLWKVTFFFHYKYRYQYLGIRVSRDNDYIKFLYDPKDCANYKLIRSNKMQQYAGIYLLQNHSTCFGYLSHPLSGVHKSVTAASGTGRSIWATTFLRRGLIKPRQRKVVAQILWPVPEAAVTVLFTPDDGCDGHPKHVEWFCSK